MCLCMSLFFVVLFLPLLFEVEGSTAWPAERKGAHTTAHALSASLSHSLANRANASQLASGDFGPPLPVPASTPAGASSSRTEEHVAKEIGEKEPAIPSLLGETWHDRNSSVAVAFDRYAKDSTIHGRGQKARDPRGVNLLT